MSETVHYKGTLTKVERFENETLEEHCKRLLEINELPEYYETYEEVFNDRLYKRYIIYDNNIYSVYKKEIGSENMFNANINQNGEIEFEVMYYNGGCGFTDAINYAMENIKQKENNL